MNFEWDPAKARRNRRKHRISFEEAITVFGDPASLTYLDPDHSISEHRFVTVGVSGSHRLVFVAHADWNDTVRIISARKATPREREQYEEET